MNTQQTARDLVTHLALTSAAYTTTTVGTPVLMQVPQSCDTCINVRVEAITTLTTDDKFTILVEESTDGALYATTNSENLIIQRYADPTTGKITEWSGALDETVVADCSLNIGYSPDVVGITHLRLSIVAVGSPSATIGAQIIKTGLLQTLDNDDPVLLAEG